MLHPDLLKILACPETKTPLLMAENALIEALNLRIRAGRLLNRAQKPVHKPLEGGLIRADGQVLYPIQDEIPILLIEEAIPLMNLSPPV